MALSSTQRILKRSFDIVFSSVGLICLAPLFVILLVIASIDTTSFGIISQVRIGQYGKRFKLLKYKTMRDTSQPQNYITTVNDPRITKIGRFLRRTKLDELPQLWNVLVGDMSFVGPRPDVPGYANKLQGEDRIILEVKPGITGPASLAFKNEEVLLSQQENPKAYNDEVIWPEKVKININYIRNYRFINDIKAIFLTLY